MRAMRTIHILTVALVGAILTLSVCVNACSEITSASTSCPKHQGTSDCCKHSTNNSESVSWNLNKHGWNANAAATPPVADLPYAFPVLQSNRTEFSALRPITDSSGLLPPSIFSRLRI